MVTDIIFYSSFFFVDLPAYSTGAIDSVIEWDGTGAFEIKLKLPERVAIS